MRKIFIIFAASVITTACNKVSPEQHAGNEITLLVGDMDFATTKATAITSIPSSLYWCATTGTSGSAEVKKYANTSASVNSSKINTGKYQTASPTSYNWYVSNASLTVPSSSGAVTASCSNTTDIIAGVCKSNNTTSPSVTLNHVFARTGTLTLNTQQFSTSVNYKLSNVSWKIQSKSGGTGGTAGTYNIGTDSWSNVTALSQQSIGTADASRTNENIAVHTSDLYCTPGVYTVSVSYRLSKYNDDSTIDYYNDFTKSADITLKAGNVNNITATAKSGDAHEIVISVSLAAWGTNNITMDIN